MKESPNLSVYIVVDINKRLLDKHMQSLADEFSNVNCFGIWGSFDAAQRLATQDPKEAPMDNMCLLSLGSTISNVLPELVCSTLKDWFSVTNRIIVGQDGNTDKSSVLASYNTPATQAFLYKGLHEMVRREHISLPDNGGLELKSRINPGPPFRVEIFLVTDTGDIVIFTAYKYPMQEFTSMITEILGYKVKPFSAPDTKSCTC